MTIDSLAPLAIGPLAVMALKMQYIGNHYTDMSP